MNQNQLLVNKLHVYEKRINVPTIPTVFFTLLHEFVVFLLRNSVLQKALKIIIDKEKEAEKHLKTFEKAGLDELKSNHIKMKEYVTSNKVSNQIVIQALDTFENQLKKSDQLNRILFFPLEQVLDALLNDKHVDHSDFIQTFGKVSQINDYKFIKISDVFPKFYAWEKESAYFVQIKQKAAWYSLNQLIVFAERYDLRHCDNIVSELIKQGLDTSKLQKEHQALMMYAYFDGANSSNLFPSIEEYKCHVMRLVESIAEIIISLAPKYEISFDSSSGKFKINEETTEFKQIGCPSNIILAMLVPKKGSIKKRVLGYEVAQSKIESAKTYDRNKLEPNIYEICRSINKHIAKLGYPDFLIMQNDTIQINPIYLL